MRWWIDIITSLFTARVELWLGVKGWREGFITPPMWEAYFFTMLFYYFKGAIAREHSLDAAIVSFRTSTLRQSVITRLASKTIYFRIKWLLNLIQYLLDFFHMHYILPRFHTWYIFNNVLNISAKYVNEIMIAGNC